MHFDQRHDLNIDQSKAASLLERRGTRIERKRGKSTQTIRRLTKHHKSVTNQKSCRVRVGGWHTIWSGNYEAGNEKSSKSGHQHNWCWIVRKESAQNHRKTGIRVFSRDKKQSEEATQKIEGGRLEANWRLTARSWGSPRLTRSSVSRQNPATALPAHQVPLCGRCEAGPRVWRCRGDANTIAFHIQIITFDIISAFNKVIVLAQITLKEGWSDLEHHFHFQCYFHVHF